MFLKSVVAGGAVVLGLAGLAPAAFAGVHDTVPSSTTSAPTTKAPSLQTVWFNDTAATTGVYQFGKMNTAFGNCPDGRGVFESPVLTFGTPNYGYGEAGHGSANVSANATLRSGVGAGRYTLVMHCGDKVASVDFTVPAKQVTKKPVGAPQTGGGGTATAFE